MENHARVVFVGDAKVGKSTLFHRCRERLTSRDLGDRFTFAIVPPNQPDGIVLVELRHAPKTPETEEEMEKTFADANIVVFVFDLTAPESLESCDRWTSLSKRYATTGMYRTALFVGTKRDERKERSIWEESARRRAASHRAGYLEIGNLDDAGALLKELANISTRLQRYEENMRLIGVRGCPRGCPEGEKGRPHRHRFSRKNVEWQIEYCDSDTSVWLSDSPLVSSGTTRISPVAQPRPEISLSWLRVVLPDSLPPAPEQQQRVRWKNLDFGDGDPLANVFIEDFVPARIARNRRSDPQELDENTSLLSWPSRSSSSCIARALCFK